MCACAVGRRRHQRGWIALLLVALLVVGCGASQPTTTFQPTDRSVTPGQTTQWRFDTDPVGRLPAGATVFSGTWAVREEHDAPSPPHALCQTGTAEFPALSLSNNVYTDSVITMRFKPISGKSDQAAGIIFRVQDKDNYYILRANALESNVNLFIYQAGQRNLLKEGMAKVITGQWQELRLEVTGSHMQGFLNGTLVVETTDTTYKAGKIGLWTKSDSVTCFDNTQVKAI